MGNSHKQTLEITNAYNRRVNTNDFKDQDLDEFLQFSETIAHITRKRRSQKKFSTVCSNATLATMTRGETFESTHIDDDEYLKAMENQSSYDTEQNQPVLFNSLEYIMKYFDEDVTTKDSDWDIKELTKGKVSSALASLSSKCSSITPPPSPVALSECQIQQQQIPNNLKVKELKNKYESSSNLREAKAKKRVQLLHKTRVKQMACTFNSKINSSSTESMEVPLNLAKTRTKFPTFIAKLPSPKPSHFIKTKRLQKSFGDLTLIADSPLTKRRQLQKQQARTSCIVAENVFAQLSVKDKALLYNKFINETTEEKRKFKNNTKSLQTTTQKAKQSGQVVVEKQCSVKQLRASLEAKIATNKTLRKNLTGSYRQTASKPLFKEYENEAENNCPNLWENDAQDILHVRSLKVVLQTNSSGGENPSEINNNKNSFKRSQHILRSAYCIDTLAPPKKIRRMHPQGMTAPAKLFQQPHIEKLFYDWLEDKNGTVFDITSMNKDGVMEIVNKNSKEGILANDEVEELLDVAFKNLDLSEGEDNTHQEADEKQEIENTEIKQNESESECVKVISTAAASTGQTAGSDFPNVANLEPDNANLSITSARCKKKLLRSMSLTKCIQATDSSDSDNKSKTKKQSCATTATKSNKYSDYVRKLLSKTVKPTKQTNKFELLREKVNSPLEVRKTCTLINNAPTLPNVSKSLSSHQQQEQPLQDSFIDQGFETCSNYIESPLKSSLEGPENFSTPSKANKKQTFPIINSILDNKSNTVTKHDANTEDSQEKLHHMPAVSYSHLSEDFCSNYKPYPANVATQKSASSQFWVALGDFTAALTIQYCNSRSLSRLRYIFGKRSLETQVINFGIDNQMFCLDITQPPDNIIEKVPQENEYSQYWFSTGSLLIPFRGKPISSKQIQHFFDYIRECVESLGSLKFGIDNCEFSNAYQQNLNVYSNTPSANLQLKTSDLRPSGCLEDCEEEQQKQVNNQNSANACAPQLLQTDKAVLVTDV